MAGFVAVVLSILCGVQTAAGQAEGAAGLTAPDRSAREPSGAERARPVEGAEAPREGSPVAYGGASACWDPRDFGEGASPRGPAAAATRCRRDTMEMVELYAWAAVLGIGAGIFAADRLGLEDPGLRFGFAATGIAGTSLLVYALDDWQGGMLPGVPTAISTGILLGLFEGVLAWTAFGNEPFTGEGVGAFYLGATVAGALVGGLVGFGLHPTTGDSSLVRSGAIWGTFLSATANLAFGIGEDQVDTFSVLFTGYTAGIVAASILTAVVRPTPEWVLAMDLGGLAGAALGSILASPERSPERITGSVVGLTTVAGMALSLWLAEPEGDSGAAGPGPTVWGGPSEGGAMVGMMTRF